MPKLILNYKKLILNYKNNLLLNYKKYISNYKDKTYFKLFWHWMCAIQACLYSRDYTINHNENKAENEK